MPTGETLFCHLNYKDYSHNNYFISYYHYDDLNYKLKYEKLKAYKSKHMYIKNIKPGKDNSYESAEKYFIGHCKKQLKKDKRYSIFSDIYDVPEFQELVKSNKYLSQLFQVKNKD